MYRYMYIDCDLKGGCTFVIITLENLRNRKKLFLHTDEKSVHLT